MKKKLLASFRCFLLAAITMLSGFGAKASHVVGIDLHYNWISGNTYKVTLVAYGDCGPSSASAFSTLYYSTPKICIYDGGSYITTITLKNDTPSNPLHGKEITPVCPADSNATQCHSSSSTIPGIVQFVYVGTYVMPHRSTHWRFVFYGDMGSGSATGRAAAITNIVSGTTTQLEDTLNNSVHDNSNPALTIVPVPFFCLDNADSYNPGAVDADGDSLNFMLVRGASGSGSGCTTAGFVTYTGGHTATNPLTYAAGTYSFDRSTGQILFYPNATQRALVVYNIEEFRNDTLIGTSMREMTFLVITCSNTPPSGGFVSASSGTLDDSTHFHICANTDSVFNLVIAPSEPDTSNVLYVTTTGVPAGCYFIVTNDSTNHPTATIRWSTFGVTPGIYTFYVVVRDNNCPLNGSQTLAFTISILPIPSLAYTIITPSTCSSDAVVSITPGGLGSPWKIDLLDATSTIIHSHTGVTSTYLDTIATGNDTLVIYSNLSNFCNARLPISITQSPFPDPVITYSSPTYCGANDGVIHLRGLDHTELDTITYNVNGVPATPLSVLTTTAGDVDIPNLCAGIYDNFVVNFGRCHTTPSGSYPLVNPGFSDSFKTKSDPSACGYDDGFITLNWLHPGQVDTINYTKNGVAQAPIIAVVNPDSTLVIPNLSQGLYSNIVVTTPGSCTGTPYSCTSNRIMDIPLVAPGISSAFTYNVHLGCKGDTVFFNNGSLPATGLTYRWYFGDGRTDTAKNPVHVYRTTVATNYTAKLIITNSRCQDSTILNISLPETVKSSFTTSPDSICQGGTINFTNTSTGVRDAYTWYFGDGNSTTAVNGSNVYMNTGSYVVTLVAKDDINCFDTSTQLVQVDSNSAIGLTLSDSIICRGGLITFTGAYTGIGLTHVQWSFGDGTSYADQNPVQHAFDLTGGLTINLDLTYRLCPPKNISKNIRVYAVPNIYLGEDTSICAGGTAYNLIDHVNSTNPLASWLWNTGDITPGITVVKAGTYSATVTINGCIASDTVVIANDCYADFPSVFTPNGDGVNDYFFPRQYLTKGLTEFSMDIYNRWGQLIYQANTVDGSGWDGSFNAKPQPEGVYIYVISAKFKDGQMLNKQGNITLVR